MQIFPTKNDKLITSVIISFLVGLVIGFVTLKGMNYGVLITAIATLAAAFFGAIAAYKLEDNNKKREEKRKNLEKANHVLYALYERIAYLKGIQKQSITPERDNPAKSLTMRPVLNLVPPESEFNVTDILFLLGTKHKQLVLDLHLEKERFNSASTIFNFWKNLFINEVEPTLEQKNIKQGGDYSVEKIRDDLGPRLYASLELSTNGVIDHVDNTIISHLKIKEELVKALTDTYPESVLLDYIITI